MDVHWPGELRDVLARVFERFDTTAAATHEGRDELDRLVTRVLNAAPVGEIANPLLGRLESAAEAAFEDWLKPGGDEARADSWLLCLVYLYAAQALDRRRGEVLRARKFARGRVQVEARPDRPLLGSLVWLAPAWGAELRDAEYSEPTSEPVRPICDPDESARWLIDRIVEEHLLCRSSASDHVMTLLAGPAQDEARGLSRWLKSRTPPTLVNVVRHAIMRSLNEPSPRCTWTPDGAHPPASWGGHWLRATEADQPRGVVSVVTEALDGWPGLGLPSVKPKAGVVDVPLTVPDRFTSLEKGAARL